MPSTPGLVQAQSVPARPVSTRLVLLGLVLVGPALGGCNRGTARVGGAGGDVAAREPAPLRVRVASPRRQTLDWLLEQPGTVTPFEVTPLVAKLPGYVESIAVDPSAPKVTGPNEAVIDIGSEVSAGQVLATIAIPELDRELAEKDAALTRARALLTQSERELAVAEAQVAAARAAVKEARAGVSRASADVDRWKAELDQVSLQIAGGTADLQTRTVVTKNWEAAKAARDEAEARVGTAEALVVERAARRDRAQADVDAARAGVALAQAERDRMAALCGYKQIVAPYDGVVTTRNVHTRSFVGPEKEPLFVVARVSPLRVFAEVPENAAGQVQPGTPAVVRVPALGDREYQAPVARTTRVVSPHSRTLRVEIDLPNTDRALAPGNYCLVRFRMSTPDALVLPGTCILAADETHYAFLVESGRVVKYQVRLGRVEPAGVQVHSRRRAALATGEWEPFTGAEQVVDGNLGSLSEGLAVVVE